MIRKINSKSGNLPVTLLVVGIFAVLGFALVTFFVADFNTSNSFVGIEIMQKVNSWADEYLFYKNSGMDESTLNSIFGKNITEEYGVRYFKSEVYDYPGFPFFDSKKEIVFTIKYKVPS